MRVDELDGNVLLVDAGQLALKLVRFFVFANVKLGLKGTDGGSRASPIATARAVDVVVVEKTEEWGEIALWEAWEEGHVACDGDRSWCLERSEDLR